MTTLTKIRRGLEILERAGATNVCAEHDEIYAGHNVGLDTLTEETMEELSELGWTYDSQVGSWRRYT